MTEWIYESPDGGKTITRRVFGKHESTQQGRHIMVDHDQWVATSELIKIARRMYKERCLRYEYPALNEMWEQYHTMLKLVSYGD